ncbi:uncharacterized protein LOC113146543, partial [Cyclospora cayetanensis]|uniref:Uncharacterized protein LOC113146543 n=1 Tax=Cyclospora cayetanensis TaxID=88456 RepID=A0A6P6RQF7_9EIME
MTEEAPEGVPPPGGASTGPPIESTVVAHLSAARSLVREGQLLLREAHPFPPGCTTTPALSAHQIQNLLHVYQLCEQALKHLDACGLPLGSLRSLHHHEGDAAAASAARWKLQHEQHQMLPEGMAKAGKAQGFFALVTMAEALRAMGNYEDSLLCYTESLQWTEGLCGAAEQTKALLAAAAVMAEIGRHTAIAAEAAEAAEAFEAAKAAAASTPPSRKGSAAASSAAAAAAAESAIPYAFQTASQTAASAITSRGSWRSLRSLMASHRRALSVAESTGLRYSRHALEGVLLLSPGHIAAAARLVKVLLLQGDFPAAAKALQHVLRQQLNTAVHVPRKILWLRGLLQGDAAAASAAASFLASAQSLASSSSSSSGIDAAAAAAAHDNDLAAQFLAQQQQRLKRQLLALKAEDSAIVEALRCGSSSSYRPLLLPLPLKSAAASAVAPAPAAAAAAAAGKTAADETSQVALVLDALRLAFLQGSSGGSINLAHAANVPSAVVARDSPLCLPPPAVPAAAAAAAAAAHAAAAADTAAAEGAPTTQAASAAAVSAAASLGRSSSSSSSSSWLWGGPSLQQQQQQQQQQQRSRGRLRNEKPRRLKFLQESDAWQSKTPFSLWKAWGALLRMPSAHREAALNSGAFEHNAAIDALWGDFSVFSHFLGGAPAEAAAAAAAASAAASASSRGNATAAAKAAAAQLQPLSSVALPVVPPPSLQWTLWQLQTTIDSILVGKEAKASEGPSDMDASESSGTSVEPQVQQQQQQQAGEKALLQQLAVVLGVSSESVRSKEMPLLQICLKVVEGLLSEQSLATRWLDASWGSRVSLRLRDLLQLLLGVAAAVSAELPPVAAKRENSKDAAGVAASKLSASPQATEVWTRLCLSAPAATGLTGSHARALQQFFCGGLGERAALALMHAAAGALDALPQQQQQKRRQQQVQLLPVAQAQQLLDVAGDLLYAVAVALQCSSSGKSGEEAAVASEKLRTSRLQRAMAWLVLLQRHSAAARGESPATTGGDAASQVDRGEGSAAALSALLLLLDDLEPQQQQLHAFEGEELLPPLQCLRSQAVAAVLAEGLEVHELLQSDPRAATLFASCSAAAKQQEQEQQQQQQQQQLQEEKKHQEVQPLEGISTGVLRGEVEASLLAAVATAQQQLNCVSKRMHAEIHERTVAAAAAAAAAAADEDQQVLQQQLPQTSILSATTQHEVLSLIQSFVPFFSRVSRQLSLLSASDLDLAAGKPPALMEIAPSLRSFVLSLISLYGDVFAVLALRAARSLDDCVFPFAAVTAAAAAAAETAAKTLRGCPFPSAELREEFVLGVVASLPVFLSALQSFRVFLFDTPEPRASPAPPQPAAAAAAAGAAAAAAAALSESPDAQQERSAAATASIPTTDLLGDSGSLPSLAAGVCMWGVAVGSPFARLVAPLSPQQLAEDLKLKPDSSSASGSNAPILATALGAPTPVSTIFAAGLPVSGCFLHPAAVRLAVGLSSFILCELVAVTSVCCCCFLTGETKRFSTLPIAGLPAGAAAGALSGSASGGAAAAAAAAVTAAVAARKGSLWKDLTNSSQIIRLGLSALLQLAGAPLECAGTAGQQQPASLSEAAAAPEDPPAVRVRWQLHPLTFLAPTNGQFTSPAGDSWSGFGGVGGSAAPQQALQHGDLGVLAAAGGAPLAGTALRVNGGGGSLRSIVESADERAALDASEYALRLCHLVWGAVEVEMAVRELQDIGAQQQPAAGGTAAAEKAKAAVVAAAAATTTTMLSTTSSKSKRSQGHYPKPPISQPLPLQALPGWLRSCYWSECDLPWERTESERDADGESA